MNEFGATGASASPCRASIPSRWYSSKGTVAEDGGRHRRAQTQHAGRERQPPTHSLTLVMDASLQSRSPLPFGFATRFAPALSDSAPPHRSLLLTPPLHLCDSVLRMSFTPSVSNCESQLRSLLSSWRSRYHHIILLHSADNRVVKFTTEWSVPPTPAQPLPELRIQVHFCFLFDAKSWARAGNEGPPPAQLSYRIEHESLVHSGAAKLASNIDHHILRHLQSKAAFAARNPLPLTEDQKEFFESRQMYEPLRIQPLLEPVAASDAQQGSASAASEEQQGADEDS